MCFRFALLGLLVAASGLPGAAQTRLSPGLSNPAIPPQLSSRFSLNAPPSFESFSRFEDLSEVVSQEDTPFSSETRLPFAKLLAGRCEFAAFKRDIATRNLFVGLPDSTLVHEMTFGTLTPRGDELYGFRLSFRMGGRTQPHSGHSGNPLKTLLLTFRGAFRQ